MRPFLYVLVAVEEAVAGASGLVQVRLISRVELLLVDDQAVRLIPSIAFVMAKKPRP